MATANAAATLERANDFKTDYATATYTVKAGANTLVTHTLNDFTVSNSGQDGLATANVIGDATITGAGTQTADSAEITAAGKTYSLSVGLAGSGADVIYSSLSFINGETSSVSGTITFPA